MKRIGIAIIFLFLIIILVDFWFLKSQRSQELLIDQAMKGVDTFQKVNLLTSDGVQIIGNYYPVKELKAASLFLHMMPETKESWNAIARALQEEGIASLAIDLRGHGESVKRGSYRLNYQNFSNEEHQASKLDVEAALDWISKEMGLGLEKVYLVGASIGANLALQTLYEHPEIKKGVALSPGLDYRGIEPKPMVEALKEDQAVFYATSKDDGDNVKMVEELYNATSGRKEWKVYDNAGHGTNMVERANDLIPSIIEFLTR